VRRVAALLLVLALASSACTEDDPTDEPKDGPRASAADEASERLTVGAISFALPDGWRALSEEDLDEGVENAADSEAIAELTESLGIDADQFAEFLDQVDLYVYDAHGPENDFTANLNVTTPDKFPDDDQLEQLASAIGAEFGGITHEKTELGDAAVLSYELTAPTATAPIQGRSLWLDVDGTPTNITISTTVGKTADELAELVLTTLDED